MTTVTLVKPATSHGNGEYNYEEYSKMPAFNSISYYESVPKVKKINYIWTSPTPTEKGYCQTTKKVIRKYELRTDNS